MNLIRRSLTFHNRGNQQYRKKIDISEKDYYLIRCQANGFYLREQLKSYKLEEGDHVQVIGGELSESSILSFLWMFKYDADENCYQIIHARTDLSLASDQFECEIQFGSLSETQNFNLQLLRKEIFPVIRIKDHDDNYLCLDGILQANDYADRDPTQQFQLIPRLISEVPAFSGTGFIWTADSSHALDLTNASRFKQNDIILYKINYRMNQRWVFEGIEQQKQQYHLRESIDRSQTPSSKIHIRSALTQQFVSYSREHHALIQSSYPQEWRLKHTAEDGCFYIEHVKYNLFLGYNNQWQLGLHNHSSRWLIPDWQTALQFVDKKEGELFRRMKSI